MEYYGAELRWFLRHHLSFEIVRPHRSKSAAIVLSANVSLPYKAPTP